MTTRLTFNTRPSSHPTHPNRLAGFAGLAALMLTLPACGLLGVEPEEIDIADGDTGLTSGADDPGETGSAEGMGDGDGDEGPGDGDTGTGDGDGDSGDGDGDTGSGDGDGDMDSSGDGDGDGDPADLPCADLGGETLMEGPNPITIFDGPSMFQASCGAPGPESVYVYTATADGLVQFELTDADFEGVVYLVGENCDPLDELACAVAPEIAETLMTNGQVVYVVVDSLDGGGSGTITITP